MSPEVRRNHFLNEALEANVVVCYTFGLVDSLNHTNIIHTNTLWLQGMETLKAVKTFLGKRAGKNPI